MSASAPIGVIDYGMGNLASVVNAFQYLGLQADIVARPEFLQRYNRLVLPGVGAFGEAMEQLRRDGMDKAIRDYVQGLGRPFLGICLGMQLLLERSTEFGNHEGLGLVPGIVSPLREAVDGLRVPHVGWNDIQVCPSAAGEDLLGAAATVAGCYFVHSFYCKLSCREAVAAQTEYGICFDSALASDNLYGCQFHPEKSQRYGLAILSNFARL